MSIKKTLFILTLITTIGASANEFVKKAFVEAPFNVIPTISPVTRLDMIDYFEHGMVRPSKSYFNDDVVITTLNDTVLTVQTSPNCELSVYAMPVKADTLTMVVETIRLPFNDSRVSVYDRDWNLVTTVDPGLLSDWMNPAAIKENRQEDVENALGFAAAHAEFNPFTNTLTFTLTNSEFVPSDEFNRVKGFIKPQRVLEFNSKTFKEKKK